MIEDGEESSMTIAATPDDGTNVKDRRRAAANTVEHYEVPQDSAEDVYFLGSVYHK